MFAKKPIVIAIDTNIFIYLLEANPVFGQKAFDIFADLELGKNQAVASELVFAEVLASPKITDTQAGLILQKLQLLDVNYVPVNEEILLKSAELRRKNSLGFADSIQVASAVISGASELITNDKELLKKSLKQIKLISI